MEEELNNLKPKTRVCALIAVCVAIVYGAMHIHSRFHFPFLIGIVILYLIVFKTKFIFTIWGLMFSFWLILDSILPLSEGYILCLLVLYIGYGIYNMNHFRMKQYVLEAPIDLSIVQMSDLHIGSGMNYHALEKAFVSMQARHPDLFVITGDLVDESTYEQEFEKVLPLLKGLEAPYGKYYIYGNHDGTSEWQQEKLDALLKEAGFVLLSDESKIFDTFTLIGRKDAFKQRKAVKDFKHKGYTIVLDHQPISLQAESEVSQLTLCGHTHDGQIWPMGWLDRLFKENDLVYGYKKIGSMHAIVTSGLGGWGYPIRTQGHSEYVYIQLKKEQ